MSRFQAILITIVLGGCATMGGSSGDLPLPMASSPESVGISSQKLAEIEAVTQKHIDAETVAGAVMLVARKGQIAWLKAMGYRDRPAKDPMRPDAIFRIYSMTKPIVTVAAMMQVEEGKLALDDPVSKYLPELAGMRVGTEKSEPQRPMTVLDLMRHTSGLVYGGTHPVNAGYRGVLARDIDNKAAVSRIAKLPLKFSPGERFEYGVSVDVLGRVVEVIDGEPLGRVLERRILEPLDMRDTAFFLPPEKVARAAEQAQKPGAKPMTVRWSVAEKPALESGGGGLLSTTRDYLRFCLMLANGGQLEGKRILKPETIALMTRDHLGAIPGRSEGGFGLGFAVSKAGGDPIKSGMAGEYGWPGNAGTLFFIDPKREVIAIYMIQVSDEHRVALRNEWRSMVRAAVVD
ncbi:MAG TPA: serine hydrolase domain-containing protein [Usitatibacter sp.]|nr:serine hydrolase domain-containing protein [Usitatibacter sp.]